MSGTLHLLPVGLGPSLPGTTHPAGWLECTAALNYFIVERAKTARLELKRLGYPHPIQGAEISEIPESPSTAALDALLAPLRAGRDAGLMSEAGCPAVADPGALVVRRAHEQGIRVVPHVGPSSLLLALMASGLNGQSFAFHGYLPIHAEERAQTLKRLEQESAQIHRTQLFIETPYRNNAMLAALIASCANDTLLCVASALTSAEERIITRPIAQWKQTTEDFDRQPSIFLLLAAARLPASSKGRKSR